ncbi:MAG: WG repeat-containing protein [Ruminococcaceae bacterium]|nr:WG repeat-containing protein [Oscillospiraceae bacterium]
MDERFLEDIVSGIDDEYINETASALYENESRNVTNSDDLIIVENKIKKFPFALVSAAVTVIAIVSVIAGVVLFNSQNINTLDSSQNKEYPLFHEEMLAIKKDGKWGYINKSGEWEIEPQFDEACAFQKNGYAIVGIEAKNDKGSETMIYGLIDKSGSYVIEPTYDLFYPFDDNGLALIKNYGSAWYIDISNNVLTKPGFTLSKTTRFWSNDYAVVGNQIYGGIKVGVIDSEGKYIIGPQFDNVFILENGCFMVEKKDVTEGTDTVATEHRYGIIDKDYNVILPVEYYSILCGDDGIYAVEHYGDAYHVDKNGKPLYNQRFSHVSVFSEYGVAVACTKDDTYGLIDKNGNYITEPVYDHIINRGSFGTYVVEKDGKYGFINYKNQKITDIIFEHAEIFEENGLAIVVKDGKYGCINKNGEFAVQPVYLSISNFTDGVAVAETKDGFILINEKGGQITNKTYGYLGNIKNERVAFYDGERTFGYLDYSGNVIFSQVFGEDVSLWVNSYSDDGYTVVYNLDDEGKIKGLGVIDHEGNFISDLCFGEYYAYEYVEEIIGDREPDIIIKISEDEKKDNIPIAFPSSPVNNKIYAHYVITENMAITAENVDTWLPYSYVRDPNAPDWYITKNEKNQMILKCGKISLPAALGAATPANIHIGDDSLEDYSLRIKFRFAEGEDIYFSLYETTMRGTIHPDYNVEDKDGTGTPTWFHLSANGKLYKEYTFNNSELILDLGELDRNEWHTLLIDNIGGSIQLVLDDENKGEIYKASTNEYGSFAFGGYEGVEIMSIKLLDIDNEYLPVYNFSYLPEKLRNELEKAGLGNDINDEHQIGMISAFVTGDTSLLPEDTDEDVRRVFEEIYSTIVIKDYYIEERDNSLHFTASYPGKSSIKANEEYVIYEFYQRAENQNDNYLNKASSDVYSLLRLSNDGRLPADIDIDFINSDKKYNQDLTDLIIRDLYYYSKSDGDIEDFRTTKQEITEYAKAYLGIDYIPIEYDSIFDENGKFKIDTWPFEDERTPFKFLRKNYKDDGTIEEVFVYYQKGDYLNLAEEHIRVYILKENENGRNTVISMEEYWQTKTESDLSYDYLGSTELTLTAEDVIYAYEKYTNEKNWELLNVLWYGNEMKWCGSKGDAESMFSDMKITSCKNVTEEEYADRFNIRINELIYHITYESDSMGEGSMFIRLKKDGANYYIKETFTG